MQMLFSIVSVPFWDLQAVKMYEVIKKHIDNLKYMFEITSFKNNLKSTLWMNVLQMNEYGIIFYKFSLMNIIVRLYTIF